MYACCSTVRSSWLHTKTARIPFQKAPVPLLSFGKLVDLDLLIILFPPLSRLERRSLSIKHTISSHPKERKEREGRPKSRNWGEQCWVCSLKGRGTHASKIDPFFPVCSVRSRRTHGCCIYASILVNRLPGVYLKLRKARTEAM